MNVIGSGLSGSGDLRTEAIDLGLEPADINALTEAQMAEYREFDNAGLFERPKDRVDFIRACMRQNALAAAAMTPSQAGETLANEISTDWRVLERKNRGGKQRGRT